MMSVKWKLFLILILSIFATAGAGVYITQYQSSVPLLGTSNEPQPKLSAVQHSQDIVIYPQRSHYETIPLERINSALQGSDPATLALNALDDIAAAGGKRKVEVAYPQRNQALVTITQILPNGDAVDGMKYRVEMTAFGRSILVSSPPVWQIIWAGSQRKCWTGNRPPKNLISSCQ